jgi:hypothetical protein
MSGCGGGGFAPNALLESHPVHLDGEQVVLDQAQVDCGTREDLWTLSPLGDTRFIGHLTQKGRNLQFSDDIQIGDPGVGVPYAQIHGAFTVKALQIGSVRDENEWTKLAESKIAVHIDHACFESSPPVLMGIRHGQFDASASPVFRFKLDGEWALDQIVH